MKTGHSLLILLLVICTTVQAQRLQPGTPSLEATVGVPADFPLSRQGNRYASLSFEKLLKRYDAYYLQADYSQIPYTWEGMPLPGRVYDFSTGYRVLLASDTNKNILLYAAMGGVLGYEECLKENLTLPEGVFLPNFPHFRYGFKADLSTDLFLADPLILVMRVQAKMMWGGSGIRKFYPAFSLGVKVPF